MLRQIARLARRVPSIGPGAIAVSVYADSIGGFVPAQEAGYEGVACVDDAARALEVYVALWEATRQPWTVEWCEGLLAFVLGMQDEDGRWVNFIHDWDGDRNRTGRTSRAGGHFWQERAVLALARASRHIDDERITSALRAGLPHIEAGAAPPDVRVLHVLTALALHDDAEHGRLMQSVPAWLDDIAACRIDGMLMNAEAERGLPHLWGHLQEGVLAEAAALIGRNDLVDIARCSADLVLAGVVESGFDRQRIQPYDVSSCVDGLSRLGRVTGESRYTALAGAARSWFDGANPAGLAVYDRDAGRVADGVDDGRVSSGSGAEANIVAAEALFTDAVMLARTVAPGAVSAPDRAA